MALDITPTRSELINLKRRIKQTKNGYKLLKMKRDGLFHEFRTLLSDMIKAKRELTESYILAKSRIDLANSISCVCFSLISSTDLLEPMGKSVKVEYPSGALLGKPCAARLILER